MSRVSAPAGARQPSRLSCAVAGRRRGRRRPALGRLPRRLRRRAEEAGPILHPALDGRRPQPVRDVRPQAGRREPGADEGYRHQRPRPTDRRALDAHGRGHAGRGRHPLDDQQGRQPRPGDVPAAHQLCRRRAASCTRLRLARRPADRRRRLRPAARRQHLGAERRPELPRRPLRPVRRHRPEPAAGQPRRAGEPGPPDAAARTDEGAGGAAGPNRGRPAGPGPPDAVRPDRADGPQPADEGVPTSTRSRIGRAAFTAGRRSARAA